ncbi:Putative 3,4-dihydroxy-2-butanone kinase [Dendrobium catenatum]|uniref:3,4-dihydroxy-2-butanone kinase n=1 Tax=Dendrobium catenatum TaxID=906689 RepID=A0A2I0W872_9ASPA|nr:Putative 3,4-dihydroxy-2-butanone kinase [Dendrobium catenatum]
MMSPEIVLISEVVHSPELMVAPNSLVNDGIEVMDLVQEVDDSLASIGKDSLDVIPIVAPVLDVVNIELCCVDNVVLDASLNGMLDVPNESNVYLINLSLIPFIRYEILCKAAYASLKGSPVITSKEWANALEAGIAAVSRYGGAGSGYRTMLDALIPVPSVLKEASVDPVNAFAGRSSYVSAEMLALVPEPGAMAVASWYRAAAVAVESRLRPSKD